jgi:hypothetical protein
MPQLTRPSKRPRSSSSSSSSGAAAAARPSPAPSSRTGGGVAAAVAPPLPAAPEVTLQVCARLLRQRDGSLAERPASIAGDVDPYLLFMERPKQKRTASKWNGREKKIDRWANSGGISGAHDYFPCLGGAAAAQHGAGYFSDSFWPCMIVCDWGAPPACVTTLVVLVTELSTQRPRHRRRHFLRRAQAVRAHRARRGPVGAANHSTCFRVYLPQIAMDMSGGGPAGTVCPRVWRACLTRRHWLCVRCNDRCSSSSSSRRCTGMARRAACRRTRARCSSRCSRRRAAPLRASATGRLRSRGRAPPIFFLSSSSSGSSSSSLTTTTTQQPTALAALVRGLAASADWVESAGHHAPFLPGWRTICAVSHTNTLVSPALTDVCPPRPPWRVQWCGAPAAGLGGRDGGGSAEIAAGWARR